MSQIIRVGRDVGAILPNRSPRESESTRRNTCLLRSLNIIRDLAQAVQLVQVTAEAGRTITICSSGGDIPPEELFEPPLSLFRDTHAASSIKFRELRFALQFSVPDDGEIDGALVRPPSSDDRWTSSFCSMINECYVPVATIA